MCDPLTDPTCVVKSVVGGAVGSASSSVFDQMAGWWADAYKSMTDGFSKAFLQAGNISIGHLQSSGLWKLEVGVGATIALGGVIWAGARAAWTHSGEAVAVALVGLVKAVLATVMVFAVVTTLLAVADGLTEAIVKASAGDNAAFASKISKLADLGGAGTSGALLFVFSILGLVVTLVLWLEMLIRAAGIVIVTVSTPIGAAGLVSSGTEGWWRKMVATELSLIFIKPIVALVLAVGFTAANDQSGIQGVLVGFMILAAAAIAWPMVARMFVFFEGQFAIAGVAAAFGMAEAAHGRVAGLGGRATGGSMWQSMEAASDRSGGGGGPLGNGGAAQVGSQPLAGGGGAVAGPGELGGAASSVGAAQAVPAVAGVLAARAAAGAAVNAPGGLVGRAGDMAGVETSVQPPGAVTYADRAQAPAEQPVG